MLRLVGVELTRLRWRRAVVLLVAAAVVLAVVVFGFVVHETRPLSPAEAATDYVYRSTLSLVEQREAGSGLGLAIVLALFFLLVGTTFAGHDWNTGSMSNQLLVEPRRGRVWLAKAAVVAAAAFVVCLVVLTLYWSGLWAVAVHRDIDIRDHAVAAAYKQGVLAALLAAAATVTGFALTMLFRSTVATLGVLVGVLVGGAILWSALGIHNARLSPFSNVEAYLVGSSVSYDWNCPGLDYGPRGPEGPDSCISVVTRADSVPYLGGIVLLTSAASVLAFRRRDVP